MSQQNTINMLNQLLQRTGKAQGSLANLQQSWGQTQLMKSTQQSPSVIDIEMMDSVFADIEKAKTQKSQLQQS